MGDLEEEFTPRAYQVDLYEKAVSENTIIYLPTGSGKTFIAVMLIKKYSNQVQLPYSQGGKRIFFIVNTVPLVSQQSDYVARHTGLHCRGYSGDMAVDYWTKEDWLKELEAAQVLVMVADIFLAIVSHGHMLLNEACLIIFDECHKGVGNHPMRSIMKTFERYKKEEQPRVLGLTATLLNANVPLHKVENTVRELEITFHAKVAAVDAEISVKDYGNLKESFKQYDTPLHHSILTKVLELIAHMIKVLSTVQISGTFEGERSSKELAPKSKNTKLIQIVEDAKEHILTAGLYGGSKAVLLHMIQLETIKKFSDDNQTVAVLEFLVTQLTKIRKMMCDAMDGMSEYEKIYQFSSDQVLKTFSVLRHFYNHFESINEKFCSIVFVRRRSTAQILYNMLKNLSHSDPRFSFLSTDFIVGYSNNPYKNPREALCLSKWNKEALRKFRSGQINCMVATDVVDEGVDIPICSLILRYDLPMDFRGYIQSKGRARNKAGHYVMLRSVDDCASAGKYQNYQKVERFLKMALIGRNDEREEVSKEELDERLYKNEIEPYVVVDKNGIESIVTGISAISLINRYCANLVKSKFVNLTPTWKLKKITSGTVVDVIKKFKVTLTLPPTSPLKDTCEGNVMESIPLAKRSAAINTCIKLHKMQELSDHLLPQEPSAILDNADHLFPHWEEEPKHEAGLAGTSARKRRHDIKHPNALYAAFPQPETTLYLHIIEAKPSYSKPFENRLAVFYDLLNDDAGFALLTTKPLPELPNFPIFMNVGDLNVNIKVNSSTFALSAREINELRYFHWLIFGNVLNTIKSFMTFDTANEGNSYLVVPTDSKGQINWPIVQKYKTIEDVPPSPAEERNILDYELALITPNYRSSPSVYVVTQICEDIMAESAFPTQDFYSYQHYFTERHGLVIQDGKQPMLEVKAISKKINCILPRHPKAGLSKRKRADLLEDFQEHLVAELCNRIVFSALYWLKATYLPSVLHRINQLLVAEDLRVKIASEAKLGEYRLAVGSTWPPVIIKQTDTEESPEVQLEESGFTADDAAVVYPSYHHDIPLPDIDTLGLNSKLYPWTKDQEPQNIFKELEQVQLINIEYYHQFMATPMATSDDILKKQCHSHEFVTRPNVKSPPLTIMTKNDSRGPSPTFLMQSLTSKMAHDIFDLERLETLGDSFLKFAVSLYLFENYPNCNEGQLTVIKGKIIGNRNLFYCGKNKSIPGRMKVDDFVPNSTFIPPAFSALRPLQSLLLENEISPNVLYEIIIPPAEQLTGNPSLQTIDTMQERVLSWNETNSQTGMEHFLDVQTVPDKSVSDCVEALIGVYLNSMGLVGAFKILMWFGILPNNLNIDQVLHRSPTSPKIGLGNPDDHMPRASYIEKQIGYKFKDRAYLLQAFTHPSYTPNTITGSYERLEFLGDAILDFLITVHIYESCDYLTPGALTDLRSALVNNITFACLAVKYGFHTALMSYAPKLQEIIERFVKFQADRNYVVDDELMWILLEEEECHMAEYVDVPKILGDLFESVIGAIYLDTGKNLAKVWEIVYGLMSAEIIAFSRNVPKQPVRVIHETPGAHPRFSKSTAVDGSGSVMISLEVVINGKTKIFNGFGANKKQAKCAAAKQALKCIRCNP